MSAQPTPQSVPGEPPAPRVPPRPWQPPASSTQLDLVRRWQRILRAEAGQWRVAQRPPSPGG